MGSTTAREEFYLPSNGETGWGALVAANFTEMELRANDVVNVKSPEFGAEGDGSTDDTDAIQAAIDYILDSGGAADTVARRALAPLYFPPGTYKVSNPLHIYSSSGFSLFGAGMHKTRFKPAGTMDSVFDLNGAHHMYIGKFSFDGSAQSSTSVDNLFDLYWDIDSAVRSTNFVKFEEIYVGDVRYATSAFRVARRAGGIYAGNPNSAQNDHISFHRVQIVGQWEEGNTTTYQNGFFFGTGAPGNTIGMYLLDNEIAGSRYNVQSQGVDFACKNALVGIAEVDFYMSGVGNEVTLERIRSERSGRLFEQASQASALSRVAMRDILWGGITTADDGYWMKIHQAGVYVLENALVSRGADSSGVQASILMDSANAVSHLELKNIGHEDQTPGTMVTCTGAGATWRGTGLYQFAAGGGSTSTIAAHDGEWVGHAGGITRKTQGTGSPEGAITAPVGSTYVNKNGGAGTTLYVKESGAGNTGWVGK